ncbi:MULTISPECIES: Gfo/Idh/MocA family protein [unclassified Sphingobacterium]|uniref:Gfo/Idh/MocA family protein n=1 Tax=unclassified Sphingobacterium TaxID=2609468 RepID=UPI0025EB2284|nr:MULTISPECIES: Gfo/Idh/MocA family oxidoreductase [unclassified Sphingobacterium]
MAIQINWGMIGAGDVTEVKSGPAFKKVANSDLIAVMRRNEEKVKDYAERHGVSRWYTDGTALIGDQDVNAVYIATPPDSHVAYAIAAMEAGKDVYVEKPMALNSTEAEKLVQAQQLYGRKLVIAHYRRAQPYFRKIKELLKEGAIGTVRLASVNYYQKILTAEQLEQPKIQWRVDPEQSGGGLFHDIAPHQIDLMYYFFGKVVTSTGISHNQAKVYPAHDMVSGQILFESDIMFQGTWAFNAYEDRDECEIIGSEGRISFSFFDQRIIRLSNKDGEQEFEFALLPHVQQPMIEEVVNYFGGVGTNPCSAAEGLAVMQVMDSFTGH